MSILDDARARRDSAPAPRRIDYDRMNRVMPKQRAALTRAVNAYKAIPDPRDIKAGEGYGDRYEAAVAARAAAREKIAAVCKAAVAEWDAIGAWPDQWATWQVALNDALGVFDSIDLRDL